MCAIAGVLTIALPVPIIVSHFQFFYQSSEVVKKLNKETLKAAYIQEKSYEELKMNEASLAQEMKHEQNIESKPKSFKEKTLNYFHLGKSE